MHRRLSFLAVSKLHGDASGKDGTDFFFIERQAFIVIFFFLISLLVLRIDVLFYLFSIILSFFPPSIPGTKLTNHTVKLSCALMLMSKYGSC